MKVRSTLILAMSIFGIVCNIHSKILIFTYSYNRPDFIDIQYKTFKKFLLDDYEFVVFSDARNQGMHNPIEARCKKYGLRCIRFPQHLHNKPYLQRWPGENYNYPTIRCCNIVQYSLDTVGFNHDDIVVLFDSDMFLVKEFSIREFLEGYDLAGVRQGRVKHLSIDLAFLNMATMPNKRTINFNCGRVNNIPVDAGGQTYHYLKNNPEAKVREFGGLHISTGTIQCQNCKQKNILACTHNTELLKNYGFDNKAIKFIQAGPHNVGFKARGNFLHYRGGTNWNNMSAAYHNHKTKLFNEYINDILGD